MIYVIGLVLAVVWAVAIFRIFFSLSELERKVNFFEEKQDPELLLLLEEARLLNIEVRHHCFDSFTVLIDGNGLFFYRRMDRQQLLDRINLMKATKFDECKKAGTCPTTQKRKRKN